MLLVDFSSVKSGASEVAAQASGFLLPHAWSVNVDALLSCLVANDSGRRFLLMRNYDLPALNHFRNRGFIRAASIRKVSEDPCLPAAMTVTIVCWDLTPYVAMLDALHPEAIVRVHCSAFQCAKATTILAVRDLCFRVDALDHHAPAFMKDLGEDLHGSLLATPLWITPSSLIVLSVAVVVGARQRRSGPAMPGSHHDPVFVPEYEM